MAKMIYAVNTNRARSWTRLGLGQVTGVYPTFMLKRAGIACWLERRTRDRKVTSSNPGGSGGRNYSPELTFCADSYSVSVPSPCYRSGT